MAWRGEKVPLPQELAFQATTHRRKAQTREAINCSQRKKDRVERIRMKKDLRAGKLVQINETMRALTFLMDVSG